MQKFFSHGKLLISGEYVVLDGATAFAVPSKLGQSLQVKISESQGIYWKSLDHEDKIWFEHTFQKGDLSEEILSTAFQPNYGEVGKRLWTVLKAANQLQPNAFSSAEGFEITTKVDFPLNWGLGTSSTLVANISKWLDLDAYKLLGMTFGGSGYDVAVALNASPVTYEVQDKNRSILTTSFNPVFKDDLFFVHLNKKQNSRTSIRDYRNKEKDLLQQSKEKISRLTHKMITCTELEEFELLLEIHENVISQLTGFQKIKTRLFPDYKGVIKSLGGWGGDFVLATGKEEARNYFREKGYKTIIPYRELILS